MGERTRRVLIVDDEPDIVRLLTTILRDYHTVTAGDGNAGLELLRREKVDIILCDQMMPGLTGVELLKEAAVLQPNAVRVLVTASDRISALSDAINLARVHRFVCKPIRAMEIRSLVAGALRECELQDQLEDKNRILKRALEAVQAHEVQLQHEVEQRDQELDDLKSELEELSARSGQPKCALVVEPDAATRAILDELLIAQGCVVAHAATVAEAKQQWAARAIDLIITAEELADGGGRELLDVAADCELILTGKYTTVDAVVEAMALDIADYFVRPLTDPKDLSRRVRRVLRGLDARRKERETLLQLRDLVTRDPLTGLFNHAHFHDTLESELLRSVRHKQPLSVVLLDLDQFKEINDNHGHLAGDACLKAFADVLLGQSDRSEVRFRLRGQDLAARYGGDEFGLILPSTPKAGAAVKAELLRKHMEAARFEDLGFSSQTVSIGVASYPEDADDRVSLVAAADAALYAAKRGGRNALVSYSPSLAFSEAEQQNAADAELARLAALDQSIRDARFRFVYQPIIATEAGGALMGFEALCRPEHDAFEGPLALFDTAERAGRVVELGRACRSRSTRPIAELPDGCSLFINLHPHELNDDLLAEGEQYLLEHAERIVFEITETAEIRDFDRLRAVMTRLRGHGFRIALDDLGAGYAGLNSLALLRPDFVKLDMALIRRAPVDTSVARLIRHVVEYAAAEGMQAVAEGVETAEELATVRELGCPYAQGYYFAKPGPPFPQPAAR
jgi:diguanylate cyclase (GGDEF)-like protein